MWRHSISWLGAASILAVLLAGCGAETDPCADAADHLTECFDVAPADSGGTCDEAVAESILAQSCEQLAGDAYLEGKADGLLRSYRRWVWRQIANFYMRPRGLDVAADFLEHSLLDAPPAMVHPPLAAEKIARAPEFQAFVDSLYSEAPPTLPHVIEFTADADLFAAFQHVVVEEIDAGTRAIRVYDRYDFHPQTIDTGSLDKLLATLGANIAFAHQTSGVINGYDIELILPLPLRD